MTMYKLTIRKTCKAEKTLQVLQKAYGFIVDYSYKTVWYVYGYDVTEIPVIKECLTIKKVGVIDG